MSLATHLVAKIEFGSTSESCSVTFRISGVLLPSGSMPLDIAALCRRGYHEALHKSPFSISLAVFHLGHYQIHS